MSLTEEQVVDITRKWLSQKNTKGTKAWGFDEKQINDAGFFIATSTPSVKFMLEKLIKKMNIPSDTPSDAIWAKIKSTAKFEDAKGIKLPDKNGKLTTLKNPSIMMDGYMSRVYENIASQKHKKDNVMVPDKGINNIKNVVRNFKDKDYLDAFDDAKQASPLLERERDELLTMGLDTASLPVPPRTGGQPAAAAIEEKTEDNPKATGGSIQVDDIKPDAMRTVEQAVQEAKVEKQEKEKVESRQARFDEKAATEDAARTAKAEKLRQRVFEKPQPDKIKTPVKEEEKVDYPLAPHVEKRKHRLPHVVGEFPKTGKALVDQLGKQTDKQNENFLDTIESEIDFRMDEDKAFHPLTFSGRYNFVGPGTRLDDKVRGIASPGVPGTDPVQVPINALDWLAMKHDFNYRGSENLAVRQIADIRFIEDLKHLGSSVRVMGTKKDAMNPLSLMADIAIITRIMVGKGIVETKGGLSIWDLDLITALQIVVNLQTKSTLTQREIELAENTSKQLWSLITSTPIKDESNVSESDFDTLPRSTAETRGATARAISAYQNYLCASGYAINPDTLVVDKIKQRPPDIVKRYKHYSQQMWAEMERLKRDDVNPTELTSAEQKEQDEEREALVGTNPAAVSGHYDMYGTLNEGRDDYLGGLSGDMIGPERDGDADPYDDKFQDKIAYRDAVEEIDDNRQLDAELDLIPSDDRQRIIDERQLAHDELDERPTPLRPQIGTTLEGKTEPVVEPGVGAGEPVVEPVVEPEAGAGVGSGVGGPPDVTERDLTGSIKPGPFRDTEPQEMRGSLGPMIMAEGSNDVKLSEEQDRINEKRIMHEFVLQNTEWEDRNNPLKKAALIDDAVRYYQSNVLAPSNDAMRNPKINNITAEYLPETDNRARKYLAVTKRSKRVGRMYRQGRRKPVRTGCSTFTRRLGGSGLTGMVGVDKRNTMRQADNSVAPFTLNHVKSGIFI